MSNPKTTKLKLPTIYLLSGYFDSNKLVSKLKPIQNTLIAAYPVSAASDEAILWRTDEFGAVRLMGQRGESHQGYRSSVKERKVTFPPVDTFSLVSEVAKDDWMSLVTKNLNASNVDSLIGNQKITLVSFEQLAEPKKQLISEEDKSYELWYKKRGNKKEELHAYILAKTRMILLVVNKNVPVLESELIDVTSPNGERNSFSWLDDSLIISEEYRFAILKGSESNLPTGLYRFDIKLNSDQLENSKWNTRVEAGSLDSSGDKIHTYSLAHWAKFDVTNVAGEYEIINADPISVEEAIIKQFPRSYGHLLSAANDMRNKGEVADPTKSIREHFQSQDAKIGDAGGKVAQGFIDYAASWAVMKQKSELAAKLISIDLSERIGSDGQVYNGKKSLSYAIGKALHAHLQTSEDEKIRYTLDLAFSTKDGADAWSNYRKALAQLSEPDLPTASQALKQNYFHLPQSSQEDLQKYANSFAGKMGIPKVGLDLFGKAMSWVDLASSVNAISQDSYSYFMESLPQLDTAKLNYEKVADDYFFTLGEKAEDKNYELHNLFQFDSAELQPKSSGIIAECVPTILKNLKLAPEAKVVVAGHTCDIGGYRYNIELSTNRANAIKNALVDKGIPEAAIIAEGFGESQPAYDNTSEENREKNRRVEINFNAVITQKVCPAREGIDTLERYRSLTIQRKLGADEKAVKVASQATDIAIGVMSVIPITAPAAAAYMLAKAGGTVLMSAGKWLDECFMNGAIEQFKLDNNRDQQLNKESVANIAMLREHFDEYDAHEKAPASVQWAAQFRMRAEAISGLLALLQRAAIGSDSKQGYIERLDKYQVQAYIENFILGEGWLLPRNEVRMIRMDTFWLYAINDTLRKKQKSADVNKAVNFGLDEKNRLLTQQKREEIKQRAEKRMEDANTLSHSNTGNRRGAHYMARAAHRNGHISANFHNYFPVHHLASTKFDKGEQTLDLEGFGHTFNPVFSNYNISDYAYTCVYYQPDIDTEEWIPYQKAMKKERVGRTFRWKRPETSPFTPYRVLVVFDEDTKGILPLSFHVNRSDGVDVGGPVYKLEAKMLIVSELLDSEKKFAGRIGCVFYPFYQLGQKTFLGVKPMAGKMAIATLGAENYYKLGFLSDMRYHFECRIGDNVDSKVKIPLLFDGEENQLSRINGHHLHEIGIDINTQDRPMEQAVLIDDFLISDTKEFDYPTLFNGDKRVRLAIRIGKESPYIFPEMKDNVFQKEISETQSNIAGLSISTEKDSIDVKGFNWDTPVEFAFVATCTELAKENYKKADISWRSIPCAVKMFEDSGAMDFIAQEGPKYSTNLVYLGKVTRKRASHIGDDGFQFEPETLTNTDLLPIQDMLSQKDDKARTIVGWYKNIDDFELERYVFVATIHCDYQSPKGVKVDSLRPFGDDVFQSALNFEDEIRFVFREFKSAAASGFDSDVQYERTIYDYGITFNAPKSYTENAPWTKTLPKEELERLKPKLTPKNYNRIADNSLTGSEVKEWLEDDSKSLRWTPMWSMDKH